MSDEFSNYDTPFFTHDAPDLKELIYQSGRKITSKAGLIVMHPEDAVDSFYYIDNGRIRAYTTNLEGKEKILFIMGEGCLFGSVPSILGQISTIYIVTETPVVLYMLDHNLIMSSELFKDNLINYYSKAIIKLMKSIESLSLDCCKTRLYNLFRASADRKVPQKSSWYDLKFRYSQEDIAKIINANRATVARLIIELSGEGLIRTVNRRIQVKL